jgi:peroxiredoxin
MRVILLLSVAFFFAAGLRAQEGTDPASVVGQKIDDVKLTRLDGKTLALYDLKGAKAVVIVFLTFDCPISNSYLSELNDLVKNHKDVPVLGVCPCQDDPAELAKRAQEFHVGFLLVADPELRALKALRARVTPEVFVLDGDLVLRYRGRIDDAYAARLKKNKQVTRHDLREALAEVLAGKAVARPVTTAVGCPIVQAEPAKTGTNVTFFKDVLPILQKRCQVCHRPGELAPFSLMTYQQAVRWADDIKEFTQSRAMPPWKLAEGVAYRDERKLTDQEIATLAAWVDGGRPRGDAKTAPPPAKFADGWTLGEPDLVLMPKEDFTLGATGPDLYRCFVFPIDLPEDKFVAAYQVRPGARQAVHHTLHFLDTLGRARKLEEYEQKREKEKSAKGCHAHAGAAIGSAMRIASVGMPPKRLDYGPGYSMSMFPGFVPDGGVGGWAPGISPHYLNGPGGEVGFFLPKKCDIVVQVHYHRTGKVEKDRTQIGLYFAKKPSAKPLQTIVFSGQFLSIPAGKENYRVKGSIWTTQDTTLYNVVPHMHLLGKKIKVTMTPPGGPTTTLLGIHNWDFNWQEVYTLKEPIRVKKDTRFDLEAVYDNSAKNPNNPSNPPRTVLIGEATTNEMCLVFLDCTSDDGRRIFFRLWPGGPSLPHLGPLPRAMAKRSNIRSRSHAPA